MDRFIVYGAGSWGSTLALHLLRKGHTVRLWDKDPAQTARIAANPEFRNFLSGFAFLPTLQVVDEREVPVPGEELALLAIPSHALRSVVRAIPDSYHGPWVVATKGLEEGTGFPMSRVLEDARGEGCGPIVVLAGPSLAAEVAEGKPTAILAASTDDAAAQLVQQAFSTERFRVYTSTDVVGVQVGTALKNVVALAAGILDGLELGQNTRGALLTRGLAEIRRLGEAMGARPETFLGLAGVGDLVTTCTSPLSRNHTLGEALGRGEKLESALARIGMVVEGVRTTRAAVELAGRFDLELPIAQQVHRILFEGVAPEVAVRELMTRPLKAE